MNNKERKILINNLSHFLDNIIRKQEECKKMKEVYDYLFYKYYDKLTLEKYTACMGYTYHSNLSAKEIIKKVFENEINS